MKVNLPFILIEAIKAPSVFIVKWIDYTSRYGMGYELSDGSIGIHFNDSTTVIMASDSK